MDNKKIIAFINAENEAPHSVIELAERYSHDGADGIYIFMFSKNEKEKEGFYALLREMTKQIDVPFMVGMHIESFEDAKKAFYTGAERIVMRSEWLPSNNILEKITDRFGMDKVWMEMDERSFTGKEPFPLKRLLIKHVDLSERLMNWLQTIDASILIRDSLTRNDLEELLKLPNTEGVVTNYFEGKDMRKAKAALEEKGISVNTLKSVMGFDELKKDQNGLVPVVVQDYQTEEVYMMAYMNEEAFLNTLKTGRMTYYSRSRESLWMKGETSGHYQYVKGLMVDCDKDAILARVEQVGAACHTGNKTCFFTNLTEGEANNANPRMVLQNVYKKILERKERPKEGSYTNYLIDKGIDKILKKCGEEATELVIAAKNSDAEELKYEIADLMYHLSVLMVECGLDWEDVARELFHRQTS